MSLRTQTALAMAVTVASALVVVLILLLWGADRYLRQDLESRARDYAVLSTPGLSASYERYHESGVYKLRQQVAEFLQRSEDAISARILDVNGTVLFDSETPDTSESEPASATKIDDPWILDGVRRLEMSDRRLSTSLAGSELEVVVPYVEEWGRHRLSILYRFSYRRLSARLAYATLILGSVSGLSIMLSFAVGYVAARRVSRPLAVMTRRVEAIGKGDRASRLEIDPGAFDELRVFAEAFNTMAGELDRHLETLRQSNLDLSAANTALELKNAELEQYAYTASHELKTPLITIRSFLTLVEREAVALKSDRIQADLARITNAAQRMTERLDDLLALARLGRVASVTETVSLSLLASEAVALCAGDLAFRGVWVTIQPELPEVRVDRVRFIEVFQNLIENAVKFTRNTDQPKLEIGMRGAGPERTFFLRDNGIGIEPRFQETVFRLFDKLDPASVGSGVGLAVVRRIVAAHGGRIWIESDGAGQGTTFCFTLP